MKRLGSYSLEEKIGEGGNGQVFRAQTAAGSEVALKVLKPSLKMRTEAFRRFKSEIAVLTRLRGTRGVMPILDSGEQEGRPWFTMPLATPLREALQDSSLEEVVQAFSVFASTLGRLAERGISHRDVKPENLFCLSPNDWVIGDFGIHKGPENLALTKDGRRIGPALYSAQEMLDYRQDQDHSRADVFSLAKTLWVIATGQRLPLQGQHPEGFRGAWLENFRSEPNTAPLDRLLIRATALIPEQRMTMKQFEEELVAWLSPVQSGSVHADLSKVGALLVDPYRRANSEIEERGARIRKLVDVVKLGAESLGIVERALRTLGPAAVVNGACTSNSYEMLAALGHGVALKHSNEFSCTYVSLLGPGGNPPYLYSGLLVALGEGSKIAIRAGHVLSTGFRSDRSIPLFERGETADLDSLLLPGIISKLCADLLPPLADAVTRFAEEMKGALDPS